MIMQELKILKRSRIELFRMRCRENGIYAFQTACPGAFSCRVQFVPLTIFPTNQLKNIADLLAVSRKRKNFLKVLPISCKCYISVIHL